MRGLRHKQIDEYEAPQWRHYVLLHETKVVREGYRGSHWDVACINPEIVLWLKQNVRRETVYSHAEIFGGESDRLGSHFWFYFYFKSERDAVLFKLFWG